MGETHSAEVAIRPHLSTKTILIVEDDLDVGYVLAQMLKEEELYRVIFATDGIQALKMVRVTPPHLILLDYLLPNMDGLTVADALRTTKGVEKTPIVLMSANMPKQAYERKDLLLLEKPFELDDLLKLVKLCLSK